MKVFLLAAGKGSRISKNIPDIPKSTLEIQGKPLIQRTIEMLLKRGFDITVITGYKSAYMKDILHSYPVQIVENPFYDVTNSIASLWFARDYLQEDDCIIANADVFWTDEILNHMLRQNQNVFMLSDIRRVKDGDYFFKTKNGFIEKYGKDLSYQERTCEYVGIAYINHVILPLFKNRLVDMIERQQHDLWWENVLYSLITDIPVQALDVEGKFWAEIDFIEDYHRIIQYVENSNGI